MPARQDWFSDDARRRLSIGFAVFAAVAMVLILLGAYQLDNSRRPANAGESPSLAEETPTTPPQSDAALLNAALASGQPITLVGVGSSVGRGATLPDPEQQAPVGRFADVLQAAQPELTINATNLSVNGSVASEGLQVYRDQGRQLKPTAVVVAFGMNDGLPGAYSSGQTFPGGIAAIQTLVAEAHKDGAAVVLLTTPSPNTNRQSWDLPASLPQLYPEPAEDISTIDGAPFSTRHADFNRELRSIAEQSGAVLGDAEKHWTALVVSQGEDVLFGEGEVVHPNLTGHQGSYWLALDDVMAAVSAA